MDARHGISSQFEHAKPRVLIVDDSDATRALIRHGLEQEGVYVDEAADGVEAIASATANPPDVVVLDIMLPSVDGLTVLAKLRETSATPVILVTSRSAESDRVTGLDLGADDYLVKPFSVKELGARVRAVLRRSGSVGVTHALEFGDLRIDLSRRQAYRGGEPIALTRKEFDLLAALASAPGQVLSRASLLRDVWGAEEGWQVAATVTEHIRRLRSKIEVDPLHPRLIITVQRIGYRFEAGLVVDDGDTEDVS